MSSAETEKSGFTLIELVCVCALISILLAILTPGIGRQILVARVAAEQTALGNLAAAAQESFESTDLEGTNLAAIGNSVPSGVDPTSFSSSTAPGYQPGTTNTFDWFAKLGRQMGYSPQIGTAPAAQPQIAAILTNSQHNNRICLIGPTTETNQQRFLIVSLMAPAGELALPAWPNPNNPQDPADLALFNDIWNTNWTDPAAALPATWTSSLSAAQILAWQGSVHTGGRLWLLCVQRIVCPKYSVTINNTHATENCYFYYNLNGTTAGASLTSPANSGTTVVTGVFGGRTIQAYRGTSAPPAAQLFAQFVLRDNSEITLQD